MNTNSKIIVFLFFVHLAFSLSAVDHFDYPHKTHFLEGVDYYKMFNDSDENPSDSDSNTSSSVETSDNETGSGNEAESESETRSESKSDSESSDDEEEFVEDEIEYEEKSIKFKEVDEDNNLNYVRFSNQFIEYSQKKEKFQKEHPDQVFDENVPNFPNIKHLHLHIKGIVSFEKSCFLQLLYPNVEALTLDWDGIVRPNVVVDNIVQYLRAFPKVIKLKLTYKDQSNRIIGSLYNRSSTLDALLQRIHVLAFDQFPLFDDCFEGLMRSNAPFSSLKSLSFKDVPFSDASLRTLAGSFVLEHIPLLAELSFEDVPLTEVLAHHFINNINKIRPGLQILGIPHLQDHIESMNDGYYS